MQSGPSSRPHNSASSRNLVSLLEDIDRPAPPQHVAPRQSVNPPMRHGLSSSSSRQQMKSEHSTSGRSVPQSSNRLAPSFSHGSLNPSAPHALDALDVNSLNPPRRLSMSQDVKPKFPSAPNRGHDLLLSDDDDDIIELTGTRVPPGMRKGREPPIMIRDARPELSRSPGSSRSASSSSSSVQELKPTISQPLSHLTRTHSQPSRPSPGFMPGAHGPIMKDSKPDLNNRIASWGHALPSGPSASSIMKCECLSCGQRVAR